MSLLLWGPPGTGKTTIAAILSQQTDRRFVEVSAVSAGVKEVRAAIDAARAELVATGHETVLFVDEVHRFSKAQQDALLPGVENRWVTLVAATTENPFFSRHLAAALAQPAAAAGVADRRRRARGARPGARRRARPGRGLRPRRGRPRPPGPAGRWRRPPPLTYLEAAAGAADRARQHHDRPRDRGDRGRPGRGALRPAGRPALRRHQRLHQVGARLRRRRGAALPGPDDGGRRGPPVHRPPTGDPGQRGHRSRRPHRAPDRGGGRPGGAADRDARGAAQPRPGHDRAGRRAEVERRDHRHRSRAGRREGRQDRTGARRTCATPTTRAPRSWATVRRTPTATTQPFGIAEQQYAPDVVQDAEYYRPTSLGAEAAIKERWERVRRIIRGR